jgi:pseudouridine-5'-phosphate glycosidase
LNHKISPHFLLSDEVYDALSSRRPVVALESTVITHGLPYPQNRKLAEDMEAEVKRLGAVPATIALIDGVVRIGLEQDAIERLASSREMHKVTSRDIGPAIVKGWSGGTTVAATMVTAYGAGIKVFATGGIGGVHRQPPGLIPPPVWDISADLPQLAKTPLIVVCAGAKAILDLPATLEYLETWGVPVVGYGVDEFPAFYSRSSGLKVSLRAETPQEVVKVARAHWDLGFESAILVANPPPETSALAPEVVEAAVNRALTEAEENHVHGQEVTPYLLKQVNELTHGSSMKANLDLLTNNARLAAQIAGEFVREG